MNRIASHLHRLLSLLLLGAVANAGADSIDGAGATFPAPLYAAWAAEYGRLTGTGVRYDAVGSGAGLARIQAGVVDFGASDIRLPPAQLQQAGLLQFPAVIGAVVPVFNIAGIGPGQLRLTGEVLGDIYLGQIRRWDDQRIAALNPGLALPASNITVVHRSDASGTTFLWSEHLARSHPQWQARMGVAGVLVWPVGVGGAGNDGVASLVQRTRMAIGYVEYAYASQHRLTTALLRNRDGVFVQAGRASFEAAAAAAARWRQAADLLQPLGDAAGAASWPITGASFILLRTRPASPARSLAVMRFFDWALRHGQPQAAGLDYVPLPAAVAGLVQAAWTAQVLDASGAAIWTAAPPR